MTFITFYRNFLVLLKIAKQTKKLRKRVCSYNCLSSWISIFQVPFSTAGFMISGQNISLIEYWPSKFLKIEILPPLQSINHILM